MAKVTTSEKLRAGCIRARGPASNSSLSSPADSSIGYIASSRNTAGQRLGNACISSSRSLTAVPRRAGCAHIAAARAFWGRMICARIRRSRVPSQTAQQAQSIASLAITAAPNTCSPTTSTTTTWVPTTSPAATWTCPTADHPTGKHPRLHRPVRPIPQTHTGKLPPSLTVHFRVRLAAFGSADPDVPPGLPVRRRRRPRPRLPSRRNPPC